MIGTTRARGGGGTSICMHIGYVPRERPPFSALNFRSGAYHFHKYPKKSIPEHHHFTSFGGFCRSGDHHFQNVFNFNPFSASSSFRSPVFSSSFRSPHFHSRPGARSGALANFSLRRGTYLPPGVSSTPPPRGAFIITFLA